MSKPFIDSNSASPTLTEQHSYVTCGSGGAAGLLVNNLLTGRLQRYVSGQGDDPVQPCTHRRVGVEVEATLGSEGRVNVESNVGHCGAISDEELTVA